LFVCLFVLYVLVCPMLFVSLDCPFWIVAFLFWNIYLIESYYPCHCLTPQFTPIICGLCVAKSFLFCFVFWPLFVCLLIILILSFLFPFTASGYPFDIFKLFSIQLQNYITVKLCNPYSRDIFIIFQRCLNVCFSPKW